MGGGGGQDHTLVDERTIIQLPDGKKLCRKELQMLVYTEDKHGMLE